MLGNRFVLRDLLGRGAAGTVFSALDTAVGQKVAIKILHPEFLDHSTLERFRREVRACRPGHPNVVTVYDLHREDGRHFLSLELVEGSSLRNLLGEGEQLGLSETISIGRQVAAALAHLHQRGVIHRDVKPGNILVTPEGETKLCDMGLARPMAEGATVTETEMVVGTPAYMAPEQALAGDLASASDIYALGITLYQCLTGEVPLHEDTAVATLVLRQRSKPPALRSTRGDCPRWLDRLLRRMLDPEPGRRPDAAEVERALAEKRVRLRIRPRRRQVVLAAALVVVAAASVVAINAWTQRPAASIEVAGQDVIGRDQGGREVWRRTYDYPWIDAKQADLDGDGFSEVLVVGRQDYMNDQPPEESQESMITVLSAAGRQVTRVAPEKVIGSWSFRHRLEVNPELVWMDVDRDGHLEVLALCRQRRYFPTVILIYWSRWNVWDQVARHPGWVYKVYPPPEEGPPGFRFLAVNNRLAMTSIFASIALNPPRKQSGGMKPHSIGLTAPPFGLLGRTDGASWLNYVPFTSKGINLDDADPRLVLRDGGLLDVALLGVSTRLDEFSNPVDGPNAGRDLREMRAEFFRQLYQVKPGFRSTSVADVVEIRDRIVERCGPLLEDRVYRIIYIDAICRAFASTGDFGAAVEILREGYPELENDDLGYLLANVEAIRGNFSSASTLLQRIMNSGTTQRARFDSPREAYRVAIETRNVDGILLVIAYLNRGLLDDAPRFGFDAAMRAGARLWWDEATAADATVESADFAEEGDAVACLVRWRRGLSRPGDAERMRRFIVSNPESEGIGRAALAASLLAEGNPAGALTACDEAIAAVQSQALVHFTEHQNLQLIRALRAVALLRSGDRDLARREAESLSAGLSPDLLPGILVAEVLAESADLQ